MASLSELAIKEARGRAELQLLTRIIKEASRSTDFDAFKRWLDELKDELAAAK